MSLKNEGLSLFEAARVVGIPFGQEVEPHDVEVSLQEIKLHYLDWGTDGQPPLLFLHGALQQGHSWDFISLALCERYHVLALDARGHGNSQWSPNGDYSIDAHLKDLDGFVEALGLEEFILVGHSMGGRNAYAYASQRSEKVKALVIVDVGPEVQKRGEARIRRFRELPDQSDSYEEFADRVQDYTGRPRDQVIGALKYSIRQSPDGKWTWKYDKLLRSTGYRPRSWSRERLWKSLEGIRCPTLIVRGAESEIFSTKTLEEMLRVMPQSTSAVVPNAGHLVAGDNPAGFLNVLLEFLAQV